MSVLKKQELLVRCCGETVWFAWLLAISQGSLYSRAPESNDWNRNQPDLGSVVKTFNINICYLSCSWILQRKIGSRDAYYQNRGGDHNMPKGLTWKSGDILKHKFPLSFWNACISRQVDLCLHECDEPETYLHRLHVRSSCLSSARPPMLQGQGRWFLEYLHIMK